MTTTPTTYVIPCGAEKLDHAAPARELYSSAHWQWMRGQVEAYAALSGGRVLVLSALHGLVELDQVLAPYDVTLTDLEECITPGELAEQMDELGLADDCLVTFLPREYRQLLKEAAPAGTILLDQFRGCRGIGDQRRVLAQLTPAGRKANIQDSYAATDMELRQLAKAYRDAEQAVADARQALAEKCATASYSQGFSEYQLAKLTGFRRGTVRAWLGK